MSRFLSSRYQSMEPYTPGEQPQGLEWIKLNTNESPYPPSPKVIEAVSRQEVERLRLYSDPESKPLVRAIAEFYGVSPAQVFVGNGSDEVLAFLFLAFCDQQKPVCFPDITYGFYPVFCELFGLQPRIVPLKPDFSVDPSDYIGCGQNVVIANPNAPTGLSLSCDQIAAICASNPDHLVVMDEAYVDFGAQSCVPLLSQYPNLVVVQTFSKSRSLAGGRLGFAIASPEIIEDLNKMKYSFNPYNINRLTMLTGMAAIQDKAYFERCCAAIVATRENTKQRLRTLGFRVLDSNANFLFAAPPALGGEQYYDLLKQHGILVRYFNKDRIRDFVRITIGTPEQMQRLLEVTQELIQ